MKTTKNSAGHYTTTDGMWDIVKNGDHWIFESSMKSDAIGGGWSVGGEDCYPSKAAALKDLEYCIAHSEEFPKIERRLAAIAYDPCN